MIYASREYEKDVLSGAFAIIKKDNKTYDTNFLTVIFCIISTISVLFCTIIIFAILKMFISNVQTYCWENVVDQFNAKNEAKPMSKATRHNLQFARRKNAKL